jgi:hypothetical protein
MASEILCEVAEMVVVLIQQQDSLGWSALRR